jgi:outer membrane receptor protein involved in Fe transport
LRVAFAFAAGVTLAASGLAQTADKPSDDKAKVVTLEKYVVTGSNIPTTETAVEAGIFPVVSLDRKTIDETGYQTAAELLQKITVSNGGSVPLSNNATGFTPTASSTSVHGLGPEATLVLINGHRVASYPQGQGGTTAFVDLNTIPLSAVERIEVLKDGASAVYGADAVAGVVNIILRKNYDGSEVSLHYGNTTDKDSSEFNGTLTTGVESDKGSLTASFSYYSRAAIFNRDRAYSAVPPFLSTNSSPINANISRFAYDEATGAAANPSGVSASRYTFFATPGIGGGLASDPNGNAVSGSTNTGNTPASAYVYSNGRSSKTNYNQWSSSYPSATRYGAIFAGDRKIFGSENVKMYFDSSYQVNHGENQLAPSATGSFFTPGQTTLIIPARTANPILTITDGAGHYNTVAAGTPLPAGWLPSVGTTVDPNGNVQRLAANGAFNPNNKFNQDISDGSRFRLADFGNRIFRDTNTAFMATVGVKADNVFENWNLDAGVRYSEVKENTDDTLVSTSRFNRVLNAADPIFNPSSASYIGTTVAYNPFGYYTNPIPSNKAVVAYATSRVKDINVSSLSNMYLSVNNPALFQVPAGDVGFAAGVDYRNENLAQSPDSLNQLGDTIGSSAASTTNATRKVLAFYAEAQVPLISTKQGITGAHSLGFDVAGRYEDFVTTSQTKMVPKFGIHWQPIDDTLVLRASYGKGIRQPSLYELYAGNVAGLLGMIDPRTGAVLQETPTIVQGNRHLHSEDTNSTSAGIVWSPVQWGLKGFTIAFDWWAVERNGTVSVDLQNTLNRAFPTGAFGGLPGGLQAGEQVILDAGGNIAQVISPYLNAGKTNAKGFDISSSYRLPTDNWGRFDFQVAASRLQSYKYASLPGVDQTEYVNQDASGGAGADGYLRWKSRLNVDWTFKNYAVTLVGNFTDGFQDFDLNGDPFQVKSTWTYDAQVSYTFHDELGAYFRDTKVTLGGKNVTNVNPPVSYGGGNNSTGYPSFLYTSEGRMVYVELSKKF